MTGIVINDNGINKVQDGVVAASTLVATNAKVANTAYPMRILQQAAKATTSGTAITFSPADNTGVPDWASRITVFLQDVSTNGTSVVELRLGTSSGVVASGYVAYDIRSGNSGIGSGRSLTGVPLPSAGSAAYARVGKIVFERQGNTNNWTISGSIVHGASATPDGMVAIGSVSLSANVDRVSLTTVNGTDAFDAGSVYITCEG